MCVFIKFNSEEKKIENIFLPFFDLRDLKNALAFSAPNEIALKLKNYY